MKTWTVIILAPAIKRISTLPKPERERIRTAINSLTKGPYDRTDTKRLHGRPEWRLRMGQWRILFLVENEKITITVISINPRGDTYKK